MEHDALSLPGLAARYSAQSMPTLTCHTFDPHAEAPPYTGPDAAQLDMLRTPAAGAALTTALEQGWLSLDTKSLDNYFSQEPDHPVRILLASAAADGGTAGMLQFSILLGFYGLALMLTMFKPQMPLLLFCMWGALGVATGLLAKKYPARLRAYANTLGV